MVLGIHLSGGDFGFSPWRQTGGYQLSGSLPFTRGLWLVLLELTVLRVAWTFNFDFSHYLLAGVIWVIGWCMTGWQG